MFRPDTSALAHRYAKALLSVFSQKEQAHLCLEQLQQFSLLQASVPGLKTAMESPILSRTQRQSICNLAAKELQLSPKTKACIDLLLKKGRLNLLKAIAASLARLLEERENVLKVQVTSAMDLLPQQKERLEAKLEFLFGQKPHCSYALSNRLISGFQVRTGDLLIDYSVAGRINKLKTKLLEQDIK